MVVALAASRRRSAVGARIALSGGNAARGPISASEVPHTEVDQIQRARIIAGAVEAVAEGGYAGLTVATVIARAKISRRTFYELFEDRDSCFLAAFEEGLTRARGPVEEAYRKGGGWRERIGAGLLALLAFCDEQPMLARLLIVDALAAGPLALKRRAIVVKALVRAVDDGRGEIGDGRDPGPLAAEGVVGAVLAVLHARLPDDRRRKPLRALAGPLMSTIVLPFLGAAAAERELQRPTPRAAAAGARGGPRSPQANPLHGLDMRLTYRTLRVLCAVNERPGASNRAVADGAGIADQGQMSKLLARLQQLGLIANVQRGNAGGARAGVARIKGEPNAWTLTARGAEVVEAIRGRPAVVRQGSGLPAQSPAHTK
jgi:AcrR family transcriptional regulator